MAYQPQPGTIAYRAIAWLSTQPKGTLVTASMWAEALRIEATSLVPCLKQPLRDGLIVETTRHGMVRPKWYSLGDGSLAQEPPEQEVLPPRTEAPEVVPKPGAMFPGGVRGDEPVQPQPLEVPTFTQPRAPSLSVQECVSRIGKDKREDASAAFDCWLSGTTSELVLQGVATNDDGDLVLTGEQVAAVRRLLLGMPA